VGIIIRTHNVLPLVVYDVVGDAGGPEEIFRRDEIIAGGGGGGSEGGEQQKSSEFFHFGISFFSTSCSRRFSGGLGSF